MRYIYDIIDQLLQSDRERYFDSIDMMECIKGKKYNRDHTHDTQTWKDIKKNITKELRRQGLMWDEKKLEGGRVGFRYPLGVKDPIAKLKSDHKRLRMKQLERLVKSSADLFPSDWLADIIDGARNLCQETSPAIIGFNQNTHLTRIQLVPTFYHAIESKQAVSFSYCPGYAKEGIKLVFHPHYIREYNQRWFVFGKAFTSNGKPAKYATCALDRIQGEVIAIEDIPYVENTVDWQAYFKDIVGVTRMKGKPLQVEIETMNEYAFHRIVTKPLHNPQYIEREHDDTIGQHGIITFQVIPNEELVSLLMSYRADIRINSPKELKMSIKSEVQKLSALYDDNE